jgi:hypothetical protein
MAIPILLLVPFIWIEEPSKLVRLLISGVFILLFLGPLFRLIPQLYELELAGPFDEIRIHDERDG